MITKLARTIIGLLFFAIHAVALTTVSDNLFKADGAPCTGSLAITWKSGPTTIPGTVIIPVGVVTPGNFIAQLQPGTYSVVFNLQSGCTMTTQTWILCNTSVVLNMAEAVAGVCGFSTFTAPQNGAVWIIQGAVHGLGCGLLVFPVDSAGNVMNWPTINVSPQTCTVTVTFGTPVIGSLNLIGGGQMFPFSNATSVLVPASMHKIQSTGILSAAYDSAGNLVDGAANVDPTSFQASEFFGSQTSGLLVLLGAGGTFPFTATATAIVTQAQHGLTTAVIFPGSYDLAGNLMDPLININPTSFQVTSTFGTNNSGNTVILQ